MEVFYLKVEKRIGAEQKGIALCMVKGMVVAYAVTCIIFIACGMVLTFTNVSESVIPITALCCTALSAGIAGFDWGKCMKVRGLLWGLAAGFVYAMLLYLITSLGSGDFSIHIAFFRILAMALAGGAVGGIWGRNQKV